MGFVYVGRLDELKGIKVLFEAWKLMGDAAPELTVCGQGPLDGWCKGFIEEYGIDSISMKGLVSNEEAKRITAESQALILPTLWYEGFPMTIIEAFSVGTPVICSDLGNAGSIVEEGTTGWKFDAGNASGLVEKVKGWTNISVSVKAVYEERYTSEANYSQLLNIYERTKEKCANY